MTRRKRSKLSATQKTEIWKRWKAGQPLHEIGRAFDKPHTTIHRPWDFKLPRVNCKQVLRRPSEPARLIGSLQHRSSAFLHTVREEEKVLPESVGGQSSLPV
jgi:hypothetical protein